MLDYSLKDATIPLYKKDVSQRSFRIKETLVDKIASKLIRLGNPKIPGFIVIPQTNHIAHTHEQRVLLQNNCMRQIKEKLQERRPSLLRRQVWMKDKESMKKEVRKTKLKIYDEKTSVDGRSLHKLGFHSDYATINYASLLYGTRKKVTGGVLQMFDALAVACDECVNLDELIVQVPNRLYYGENPLYPYETHSNSVHHRLLELYDQYIMELPATATNNNALVIFSNRKDDGLFHVATQVRLLGRASTREFNYVGIGYRYIN